MTLKQTLTALCLAAGLLGAAKAETVLRYSDHEPYGNMRTRFINDVFFKNIESESQGRIKIEPHWAAASPKRTTNYKPSPTTKPTSSSPSPNTACNNCRCTNCSKAS